jgi:xylose isomerase
MDAELVNPTKHSLITGFLGKTKDRFHEYNDEKSFEEKLRVVSKLAGFSGVEIVYPYEVPSVASCVELLEKYKLQPSAINVNVKADPDFRNGGLTSLEKPIRDKAVRLIQEAKTYARDVGANKVTCCPLGDGYEFAFGCDYRQMWEFLVDSLREAGSYLPEIPLFIEYKPSETRGRCFVDTASKALCLLNDIGSKAIGVTIDYGHSKYGNENPAEALSLLAHSTFPYYIHINDNNGRWDWDFMAGSHNFIEYVEFIYYAKSCGYEDYFTSDTSPTRWDIAQTFEANSRITNKIWNMLDGLDGEEFAGLIRSRNYIETSKYIEENILHL